MRKPTPREWVYLAVLAVVAISVFWYQGGESLTGGGTAVVAAGAAVDAAPVVNLALLSVDPDAYDAAGRDLFKYGLAPQARSTVPLPAPVIEAPRPPPVVRTPPPVRQPPPRQEPVRPAARQPPRPDFKYLGYLGPKDDRIAVFEQDEMFVAKTGEVVRKDFRVVEFKYETVVLGYTDQEFAGQTTELRINK